MCVCVCVCVCIKPISHGQRNPQMTDYIPLKNKVSSFSITCNVKRT